MPLKLSQLINYIFFSLVDEEFTLEDNVEVDESLFQDLGDLENEEGIS